MPGGSAARAPVSPAARGVLHSGGMLLRDLVAAPAALLLPLLRGRRELLGPLAGDTAVETLPLGRLEQPDRTARLALDAATGLLQREVPRRNVMSSMKIAAIVLIVAGALGLLYGSFSYTKDTHTAKVGSLSLSVKDRETVNIPVWAGVAAVVAGGLLLVVPRRRG